MTCTDTSWRTLLRGALTAVLLALVLLAAPGPAAAGRGDEPCVSSDRDNLTPATEAPDWYVSGVTTLCRPYHEKKQKDIVLATSTWTYYEPCFGCTLWRTSPTNADYSARDCEESFRTCGGLIIGDAPWFYDTCRGRGLSGADVARNIRYWADRARANGPGWRVYTFAERGGYPYSCAFSVVQLY